MEFDTGSQVQPGEDITLETANGSIDLGAATYDSDADGVADSVVVIQDDLQFVITDADHDGHAESLHAFDFQGQEVDPKTGAPIAAAPDSGDASGAPGISFTGDDGADHSVGTPTVDLDKDGSPDTAIVRHEDGSVTGYTDRDGEGRADQITRVDAAGKVVIAVSDSSGGWEVTATGHLDADGVLVPDSRPNASASDPAAAGDVGEPATAPDGDSARADAISVTDQGQAYDLGRPTTDLDGDGAADTVVTHLADGTVVGYSDTDGDGTADQVTRISPDGYVVIGVLDGNGGWEQAAAGQLDQDGRFVPQA